MTNEITENTPFALLWDVRAGITPEQIKSQYPSVIALWPEERVLGIPTWGVICLNSQASLDVMESIPSRMIGHRFPVFGTVNPT